MRSSSLHVSFAGGMTQNLLSLNESIRMCFVTSSSVVGIPWWSDDWSYMGAMSHTETSGFWGLTTDAMITESLDC